MHEYRTKKEDAFDYDLEVLIDCFGVDYLGNFFKRSLTIYTMTRYINPILERWNLFGHSYKMIEGSFAPIHHYKLNKISAKGL